MDKLRPEEAAAMQETLTDFFSGIKGEIEHSSERYALKTAQFQDGIRELSLPSDLQAMIVGDAEKTEEDASRGWRVFVQLFEQAMDQIPSDNGNRMVELYDLAYRVIYRDALDPTSDAYADLEHNASTFATIDSDVIDMWGTILQHFKLIDEEKTAHYRALKEACERRLDGQA